MIHVDPNQHIALNYTCRYCRGCDLLIDHKQEIEHHLYEMFRETAPEEIGNKYLIMGTLEKEIWREGLKTPKHPKEMLDHLTLFAKLLRRTPFNPRRLVSRKPGAAHRGTSTV